MNVPQNIQNKIKQLIKITSKQKQLNSEINNWFEKHGVDIEKNEEADGVFTQLMYGEITSVEEFLEGLEKFLNENKD